MARDETGNVAGNAYRLQLTDLFTFFSCGCCNSDLSVSFGVISLMLERLSLFPRGKRWNKALCRRHFDMSNIFRWFNL